MSRIPEVEAALEWVDTNRLEQVKPDDIVILSFSGHGWPDPRGDFNLVPSEGNRRATRNYPICRIARSAAPPPKIQEPSLFDFAGTPSSVVLRQVGR